MALLDTISTPIMRFWYWHVAQLTQRMPSVRLGGKEFVVYKGVYKPLENEQSCAAYCNHGDRVLDLGTGCGVGAYFCSEKADQIVASDVSATALANAAENCRRFGVTNVEFRHSDMFDNIQGRFDLILANPPYLNLSFDEPEKQFATSTRYLPRLFTALDQHLAPGGRVLVQYPAWFAHRLTALAEAYGFRLVEKKRMPPKPWRLRLLSLIYLQVGFRSSFFLFERAVPLPAAADASDKTDRVTTAVPA
ncbi:hypothetical protein PB2503_05057 [Parvularcula bermudensis HTCC2503]|uniref:Methyltransferase small domain-containing protein n=1 Tax=Parvularcula bermudensis (strain ATCC BAA-594 / HTCC2503 / KCTC 12087) TaxID=314260 RepID=E0TFS1_PARBH|nr:class I SAM-dependent methyltransferase [Parvularcula bermudensis]ADM09086.1 hypothetical protein PB2503_05057 [Parvularcula bermudensis HTCC2503]